MLTDIIEGQLAILLDLPIKRIGRAGNLVWIGFGEEIQHTTLSGVTRMVSRYALHIQSAFRVIYSDKVLFGSYDMYEPNSSAKWTEDFIWDTPGANLYDEKTLYANKQFSDEIITVTEIISSPFGDLKIKLSNAFVIEIFVHTSSETECWRFFEVGTNENHFVVTGQGIEDLCFGREG